MKISKKAQQHLLDTVTRANHAMLDKHCEFHLSGGPEMWQDEEKRIWDMLTEQEYCITAAIKAAFDEINSV